MKPSAHTVVAGAFLPVVIVVAYALDHFVFAAAERTSQSMDTSWAWSKIGARFLISTVLVVCAAFVLSRPRPSRMVAALYLLVGGYFMLQEIPYFAARFGVDVRLISGLRVALPIAAAFLPAIGLAALCRPYAVLRETKT